MQPLAIEYVPEGATRRRVRYELDSTAEQLQRISEEWTGDGWRIIGSEPVDEVAVTRWLKQQSD